MEFVYVVPREDLFPEAYPHGFQPFRGPTGPQSAESFRTAMAQHGFFVERAYAERAPHLKQVIPYCLVEAQGRVLLVQRTKRGGDARLHDKHSIGIGGHLEPVDLDASGSRDVLSRGTQRELEEELHLGGPWTARAVGILNDDTNPVGAVHVGLVQVVRVRGDVGIREKEQLQGKLSTLEEIRALLDRGADFESWSRLLVPHLGDLLLEESSTEVSRLEDSPGNEVLRTSLASRT